MGWLSIYLGLLKFLSAKFITFCIQVFGASQVAPMVKNLPANAGDARDTGSVPGLGRSPGEGNGYLLQYSCLENPMDRGAWWATVHRVAKSWTRLKWLSSSSSGRCRTPHHVHIQGWSEVNLEILRCCPLCGKLLDSRNWRHCFSLFKATWR